MIVNGVAIDQAIWGCRLNEIVPWSTVYSRVKARRESGTYDALIREAAEKRVGLIIDVTNENDDDSSVNVSPVTMNSTNQSSCRSMASSLPSRSSQSTRKKTRLSPKQASAAKLEAKRLKLDYDGRYKEAFKDATNLIAAARSDGNKCEPVQSICDRLNTEFNLDGKKLARSTVYQAAKDGLAGTSPKKMGPEPNIPVNFLKVVATHAEVCQVGDGELRGRDLKIKIGASIVGTKHEAAFKVESVWRKIRNKFPEALQAANKVSVEDARAQWTTHDNLNQWFDDVKKDLITTGLVDDEIVLDDDGQLVSEVRFRKDSQ